jgi:SRSO17 transposase
VFEFNGDEPTRQHWVLARRNIDKLDKIAYFLACAPLDATVGDLGSCVAGCRWKIEECGLDEYEVRRHVGWYRPIALAMLATPASTRWPHRIAKEG